MEIEYLSYLDVRFAAPKAKKQWTLINPFGFKVIDDNKNEEEYEVPVAFWTDFASIPQVAWSIISPYQLGYGPIPHDFGYFTGIKDKDYWDNVFDACMRKDGITLWKRISAYQAVHRLGDKVWDDYRKTNTKHVLIRTPSKRFILPDWKRELNG
jgi:hypothetical protein